MTSGGDSYFTTIRGCSISLMRRGSGAPALYLHGAGGVAGWSPFFEELSRSFELYVPDHPGFGRSDTPPWLDNVHDLAYFYLQFLRDLDLDRVHLIGSSIGGWVALEMAVRDTS